MNHFTLFSIAILFSCVTLAQGVKVSTTQGNPDPASMLEVESTDKGFLPPRMTTTQRDAISNVPAGLQIYNTEVNCMQFYNGSTWICGGLCTPSFFSAGTHVPSYTQITWNWNVSPGAQGYKYNTINDFGSAVDLILNTTYTQTGLTCGGISYSLYVWAYNDCGSTSALQLNHSTLACAFTCGVSTVSHGYVAGVSPANASPFNSTTYTYPTVSGDTYAALGAGKCWTRTNFGATSGGTSVNDASADHSGWYFQFNRSQGYHHDGGTRTPSSGWSSINENSTWTFSNDPCRLAFGGTWRIPTQAEWNTFRTASFASGGMNSGSLTDAYNSPLQLHGSGFLDWSGGNLNLRGVYAYIWTSTDFSAGTANGMYLETISGIWDGYSKSGAFTLRCLKD